MATFKRLADDDYGSYAWLRREVSGFIGLGYNPDALTPADSHRIDSYIQSGLMQFYYPPPLPVGDKGQVLNHRWSFLSPVEELLIVDGQAEYDLPEDFTGIIEELTVGE